MHTTATVAKRLRRAVRTINHVASQEGIGVWLVDGKIRVFSDADVDRLAAIFANRTPGRPSGKS